MDSPPRKSINRLYVAGVPGRLEEEIKNTVGTYFDEIEISSLHSAYYPDFRMWCTKEMTKLERCDAALFIGEFFPESNFSTLSVLFGLAVGLLESHNVYTTGPSTYLGRFDWAVDSRNRFYDLDEFLAEFA